MFPAPNHSPEPTAVGAVSRQLHRLNHTPVKLLVQLLPLPAVRSPPETEFSSMRVWRRHDARPWQRNYAVRIPPCLGVSSRLVQHLLIATTTTEARIVQDVNQRQKHGNHDASDYDCQKNDHDRFEK